MEASLPVISMMRHFYCEWREHLTDQELSLVQFVFFRTYMFNKMSEVIPVRHFVKGVWDRDGNLVTPGIQKSRPQVLRIIKRLTERNILVRSRADNGRYRYSLNAALTSNALQISASGITGDTPPVSSVIPPEVSSVIPHINRLNINGHINKGAGLNPHGVPEMGFKENKTKVQDLIQSTSVNSKKRREVRKKKGSSYSFVTIWIDKMAEHYPNVAIPEFRKRDFVRLKTLLPSLKKYDLSDFVETAIGSWSDIVRRSFGWMKDAPSIPSVMFMMTYVDKFIEAHVVVMDGDSVKSIPKANPKEIEELKARNAQLEKELADSHSKSRVEKEHRFKRLASKRKRIVPKPIANPKDYALKEWDDD